MRPRFKTLIEAVTLALGAVAVAHADPYHYNNMLIGDRAAGMGGAYTAISDDPTGMFYNPAGIVYASGTNINGSMNAWQTTFTQYKNVFGSNDWTRQSSGLVPNFFGVIQPFAGGTLGFSYAVTDSILEDQNQKFPTFALPDGTVVNEYDINFNNQDTTYNVGPSFAYKFDDNLSVGLTLYGHYRNKKQIWNQQIYYASGTSLWSNAYLEGSEFGINPVLGVMWAPAERLSLGMTLRKTQLVYAKTRLQSTVKQTTSSTLPTPTIAEDSRRHTLPTHLAVGAAYFFSDRFLITADASYFSAVPGLRWVGNFALGSEYYVDSQWAVRAGVFSNLANTPSLANTEQGQKEHVDLYGLSWSLTHFTRNSALTGGFYVTSGSGQAQVLDNTTAIQKVNMFTAAGFLSATYSY